MSIKRYLIAFMVLSLLLLLMPACGGDGDDNTPSDATSTATATNATPTPTTTPISAAKTPTPNSSSTPVKIGAIESWSGPAAISGTAYADPVIKFGEKQVNDGGGVLGGRSIKVVKYDNRGSVAEATAGAKKLALEDKVSILCFGGVSGPEFAAVSDAAEQLKVPYVALSVFSGIEENQFTVASSPPISALINDPADLLINVLKPQTVGFLQMQDAQKEFYATGTKKLTEAAGIETVYYQSLTQDTNDLMSFLTKIQYEKPDVLVTDLDSEKAVTLAKQAMELGGWGDMKVIGYSQSISAAKQSGSVGWLVLTTWAPGKNHPASQKFEQDWKTIIGSAPSGNHVYFYISLLTSIEAIKFANTDDPVKIAQGMRSGNLEFDSPMGMAHFAANGESGLKFTVVEIQKDGRSIEFKP